MNLTAAVGGVEIKFTVAENGVPAALSAFGPHGTHRPEHHSATESKTEIMMSCFLAAA
jgi:hypothetical protein